MKKLFSFFWDKSLLSFLLIGGINTVFCWIISTWLNTNVFTTDLWGLFVSMAIPFAVLSVPSFYFNRQFSFKSKEPLLPSIARFSTIILVCFLISFFLNQLVVPWMRTAWFPGIPPVLYSALRVLGVQVLFTLLNYIGQRKWAFKYQSGKEETTKEQQP